MSGTVDDDWHQNEAQSMDFSNLRMHCMCFARNWKSTAKTNKASEKDQF